MKIGIDSSVIEKLASTSENTEYYLGQLKREGHDVKIVSNNEECRDLDFCVVDRSLEVVVPDGTVKSFLLFPDEVGTWWEIYNHIRYEL